MENYTRRNCLILFRSKITTHIIAVG